MLWESTLDSSNIYHSNNIGRLNMSPGKNNKNNRYKINDMACY